MANMTSTIGYEFRIKILTSKIQFLEKQKQNLEKSIKNIKYYQTQMEDKIRSLKFYIDRNEFPTKYAKRGIIFFINEKIINKSTDNFILDEKTVLYNKNDNLYCEEEIKWYHDNAIFWYKKWEEIKESFQKELEYLYNEDSSKILIDLKRRVNDYSVIINNANLPYKIDEESSHKNEELIKIKELDSAHNQEVTNNKENAEFIVESVKPECKFTVWKRGQFKELLFEIVEEIGSRISVEEGKELT